MRTLRLKVCRETHGWLDAAAVEVNEVFNYCNEISLSTSTRTDTKRNTSVTCSTCGALSGPRGVNGLIVRSWVCSDCGESHDRDVNAARNILIGSRCRTSVRGNEQTSWLIPPSRGYRVREAEVLSAWVAV